MCVELARADATYRADSEDVLPADGATFLQLISDADARGEAVGVPEDSLKTDKVAAYRAAVRIAPTTLMLVYAAMATASRYARARARSGCYGVTFMCWCADPGFTHDH